MKEKLLNLVGAFGFWCFAGFCVGTYWGKADQKKELWLENQRASTQWDLHVGGDGIWAKRKDGGEVLIYIARTGGWKRIEVPIGSKGNAMVNEWDEFPLAETAAGGFDPNKPYEVVSEGDPEAKISASAGAGKKMMNEWEAAPVVNPWENNRLVVKGDKLKQLGSVFEFDGRSFNLVGGSRKTQFGDAVVFDYNKPFWHMK